MPNPILEQINSKSVTPVPQAQSPNDAYMQQLRQAAQMIKNSSNPQMIMQNMIMQNPRLKEAMNFIQQMGTPEQAFSILACQKGLDPNQLMDAIKAL